MRQTFSYVKFNNETADTLVLSFNKLVDLSLEGKNETTEYKEANKCFSETLVEYCLEGTGIEYTGIDVIKNPMVNTNYMFTSRFSTILAQAITPAVPTIAATGYDTLFDVTQIGWGDNAKYTVDSNELFIVNDIAEGVARGGVQTTYNNEYTVTARRKQISTFVDWYHVASGKQDWGKFGQKIGTSFVAYIYASVVKAMTGVVTEAAKYGIGGYVANGFTDSNWMTLGRNVQLANGNSKVYALGTNIALGTVLPTAASFRFGPDSEIVKGGYLTEYKDIPMVPLGNAIVPGTINESPEALIPDNMIYMVAMGSYKPCKVVIEGNNVVVAPDPLTTADHTYGMTIDMRIGVDVVVGSKFGCLKLS
jgi:hypothetical protein